MKFLRFVSETAACTAFADYLVDGEWPDYIDTVAVDVIGPIHHPTGDELVDGVPEMEAIPGFHINLSASVPELAQYEIDAPATPSRVFAGSGEIVAPRVPSEVARWQAKIALMKTLGQSGHSLWDELVAIRAAMPYDETAVMLDAAMNEVLNWRRASPTMVWAAQQLGLSDAQVDALFISAAALEL